MAQTTTAKPHEATAAAEATMFKTPAAAAALTISVRTLQEFVHDRKIGFVKIGKSIRFSRADLDAFVESNRVRPIGWKAASHRGGSAQ